MKKIFVKSFVLICMLIIFSSCGKDNTEPAAVNNYDVTISPNQWELDIFEKWTYIYYPEEDYYGSSVVGYVMSGSGQQIMPYQTNYEYIDNYKYEFALNLFEDPGYIEIQVTNLSNSGTAPNYDEFFSFVFVNQELKSLNIDWHNYNEVSKSLNCK
ncbi:MAG: hypothetical protein ACOCWG_01755 [bacterium]